MEKWTRRIALSSIALLALSALPAFAQSCDNLSYRLWQKDGEQWHRWGEAIEIVAGQEGHVYLHVDSRGRNPYSTSAEYGYPRDMGLGGPRNQDVNQHVHMKQQNADDLASGRLRIEGAAPGQTSVGFRMTSVKSPGSLDMVKAGCRSGTIPIRVVAGGGHGGGQGHDDGHDHGHGDDGGGQGAEHAARELVSKLYVGLLRRSEAGNVDAGFVSTVQRGGREGLLEVADTMVSSSEFRRDALRITEDRHGRSNLDQLRRQLLADIYRDLYGYTEPDRDTREDDERDLEDCLSTGSRGGEACSRLGRELVGRREFYEQNKALIDALGMGRARPGRR